MSSILGTLSENLATTVELAGPSIVRVEGRSRLPASGIVWSSDGVIVTANHALERDEGIGIGLPNGASTQASLAGRDPTTDIAVLRVQVTGLAKATWAEHTTLRVGHIVLALGRPGRTVQATIGVVSALGDAWRTAVGGRIDRYVQTDVTMCPGFSGGPLVSGAGQFAGMNSTALNRGAPVAIPHATIGRVVEAILAHGRVKRGYLGIGTYPVRLQGATAQQAKQETGLLVNSVEPGSPADIGGLLLGDIVIALEKQPVRFPNELLASLGGERVGKAVQVTVVRGGQVRDLSVIIGERP